MIRSIIVCIVLGSALGGCETKTSAICAPQSTNVPCLLKAAETTLAATDDPFAWTSGASEIAIAYDQAGEPKHAIQLLRGAVEKTMEIEDPKRRASGISEILDALRTLAPNGEALALRDALLTQTSGLTETSIADLTAKGVVVTAIHGDLNAALASAKGLEQADDYTANYKAVALRKIAGLFAQKGDLQAANEVIEDITMSLTYYQAVARSDVARYAFSAGETELGLQLLLQADEIARSQDNGYFVAAALRDIGYSFHEHADVNLANAYFEEALAAAQMATKQNEKARATSRIATRLADAEEFGAAADILAKAETLAGSISSDTSRGYAFYEIVGSAGFSRQFAFAEALIEHVPDEPLGSATSMRSASQRDIAWGHARAGDLVQAAAICQSIRHAREEMQCMARVALLAINSDRVTPPRYL